MRIIICIDKSLSTEKVLMMSKTFIDNFKNKVHVKAVHIVDETLLNGDNNNIHLLINEFNRDSLEIERLAKTNIGKEIEYIKGFGSPQEKIIELLNRIGYGILIMGSHGRNGLKHLLMGSVTQYVIKHSRKPTLIIPTHLNG